MKKINFSDKFVLTEAVLSGRKTMTRRIIPRGFFTLQWDEKGDTLWCEDDMGDFIDVRKTKYAQYKVGEVVAIAQKYSEIGIEPFPFCESGWDNKMFVRADLMPHHIRITDVKVERLQSISDTDCLREGIMEGEFMNTWDRYYFDIIGDDVCHKTFKTPREAFAALIDRVSGKGVWQSNPWVFVYEFELVD